jgi:hypothetical protein
MQFPVFWRHYDLRNIRNYTPSNRTAHARRLPSSSKYIAVYPMYSILHNYILKYLHHLSISTNSSPRMIRSERKMQFEGNEP